MKKFNKPYWVMRKSLPGLDFNREIVEPGTDPKVPEGGIGIRVDDDFWAVAFLPHAEYKDRSLQDIVAELWPTYASQATYAPDHGSVEQKLHRARITAEREAERAENAERELSALRAEHERLKAGRTDLTPRSRTRMEATNGYFIAQYEHLLVAMAHEAVPMEEPMRGVCSKCGLLNTDRVHERQWIDLHDAGYPTSMPWHRSLGDDRTAGEEDDSGE